MNEKKITLKDTYHHNQTKWPEIFGLTEETVIQILEASMDYEVKHDVEKDSRSYLDWCRMYGGIYSENHSDVKRRSFLACVRWLVSIGALKEPISAMAVVGEDVEQAAVIEYPFDEEFIREDYDQQLRRQGYIKGWKARQQSSGDVEPLIDALYQARIGYVNLLDFELLKGNYRNDTEELIDKIDSALRLHKASLNTQQDKELCPTCKREKEFIFCSNSFHLEIKRLKP